ncbi:MAG: MgtC/SapB family protein [Gemmatimonadales bacterium]
MPAEAQGWQYLPTLLQLVLALAIGLFVGIERERRQKEAGLRTFAFVSVLGATGGMLGTPFALLSLVLVGVLIVLLNLQTIRTGEGAEITTSAALAVTGFAGVLVGMGQTFTPTALGVVTAALLAWKQPLTGFSRALTESELRSAILFAILAFIIYPVLPSGTIDPWGLIAPRAAWVTVILVAALGFANYVLLRLYGARGIELTGFLGGLINSTVTVTELSDRVSASSGRLLDVTFLGVVLATAAMLVRNAILLGLLAPAALLSAAPTLVLMLGGAAVATLLNRPKMKSSGADIPKMSLPFSLTAAIKFGVMFLFLEVAGVLAHRALGQGGFYLVSFLGGFVSSASAVASAANLAASGQLSPSVAGTGVIIASLASAAVNLPLVGRIGRTPALTRRVAIVIAAIILLGALGVLVQPLLRR